MIKIMNKLYKAELKAARRLARWADNHSAILNIICATAAFICAIYVFLYYPL